LKNSGFNVSKTAAALNCWLNNERNDLPLEITRMSFASYNTPIGRDGTLPVRFHMDLDTGLEAQQAVSVDTKIQARPPAKAIPPARSEAAKPPAPDPPKVAVKKKQRQKEN
jgi:hypothetical protein